MTEAKAVTLENIAIIIDSAISHDTHYAIDREGKGMWLIIDNKEIAIAKENVDKFIKELQEVWDIYK